MELGAHASLNTQDWVRALRPWGAIAAVAVVASLVLDPIDANGILPWFAEASGHAIGTLLRFTPYWLMTPLVGAGWISFPGILQRVLLLCGFVLIAELPGYLLFDAVQPTQSVLAFAFAVVWCQARERTD